MANFTDNKIKNTYQRVLQVDNGIIQDGLGNAVSASISSITGSFSGSFDGILTGPTSESLALRVSNQENFSSSLDNTYATDNELEAVSSSLAVETAQLLNFSSSLDSTYATDTDLNIVSASVDQLNIASSSYLFVTSSVPEGQLVFSKGGKEMEHRPNLHFDGIDDLSIGVLTSTGSAGRIHLLTGKNGTSTASLTNATNKLELSRDGIVGVTVDGIKGVLKYSGSDRVIPTANGVRINGNISATNVGQTTGSIIALNAATSSYINTDSTIASGQLVYGTGVGKAVESIPNFIFDGSDTLSLGSVADTGSNGRIHFVTGKESGSTASIVNKSHKLEIIRDGIVGLTVDGLKGVLKYSGSDTVIPTSTGVTVVGDVNANNINSLTSSVAALNDATSSFASTGSNSFTGDQIITGSLIVSSSSTFTAIGPSILSGSVSISGSINSVDYIDFNTGSVVSGKPGRLRWNDTDGTLDLTLKNGNVTLQVGQESVINAYNNTTSSLLESEHKAVYISGSVSNFPAVNLATNLDRHSSENTIGIATEDIGQGETGYITTYGMVRDIDMSAFTEGDTLYLGGANGELLNSPPLPPALTVIMGYCINNDAVTGSMFVNVRSGFEYPQYAIAYNLSNHTASLANTETLIDMDTPQVQSGITVVDGSKFTVSTPGLYEFVTIAQINRAASSGTATLYFWAKKNGVDVTNSNNNISITGNTGTAAAVLDRNLVIVLEEGDYIQFYWGTDDTDMILKYSDVGTSPARPATPAVKVTATRIS